MKTPEQIASKAMEAFTFVDPTSDDDNDVEERDWFYIRDQIEAAIEADRAQRDDSVHAAVIGALKDRIDWGTAERARIERAAVWIEAEPDEFWDRFAGPMLDEIERMHA